MKSNLFTLNIKDLIGSIVSAVLASVIGYVLTVGDIFILDYKMIINLSVMTALASLLKSLLTDSEGELLGKVPVK